MLKDKDRIFQNLYNDLGSDFSSSQKEGTGLIPKN
jgi:NADH-quinone oxidoreductase subunit F